LNTVVRLVLNDLRRDWKRPWTIVLYAVLPLAMATLMAAVFGGGGGSLAMPTVHVAVLDQDKDMLTGALRSLSGQGDAAKKLRLHFVDSREEGVRLLEDRKASAFLVLPPHMTEYLLKGRTNVIELYENPAEQVLPKIVRQGTSLLATGLSGAAEILGEPLTELRELMRQGSFPTEAAVTGTASKSWEKLRNVRGYLFPPLVTFTNVEAADYRVTLTNSYSTHPEP
jgi:hypothetical protein